MGQHYEAECLRLSDELHAQANSATTLRAAPHREGRRWSGGTEDNPGDIFAPDSDQEDLVDDQDETGFRPKLQSQAHDELQAHIDLSVELIDELEAERHKNDIVWEEMDYWRNLESEACVELDAYMDWESEVQEELKEQVDLSSELTEELQMERDRSEVEAKWAEERFSDLRVELRAAQKAAYDQEPASEPPPSNDPPEIRDLDIVADVSVGMIGMGVKSLPPNIPIVRWVKGNTWASRMGVRPGNAIVEVNGIKVGNMTAKRFLGAMQERPLRIQFGKFVEVANRTRTKLRVAKAFAT